MNLYERLLAIQTEMQTVAKNLTVDTGAGRGYKAVSERDVIDAVKPIEAKYGVYSYPCSREIVEADRLEKKTTYNGTEKTTTSFYIKLKTVYRFVNVNEPTEYIEITSYSTGLDAGDKAEGKAMTYGDKYALMKAYKISTGDDPDAVGSDEAQYKASPIDQVKVKALALKADKKGVPLERIMDSYGVSSLAEMNLEQWESAMRRLEKTEAKNE